MEKPVAYIERIDAGYAWGICTCGNTVKFDEDKSVGCCPACGLLWRCVRNKAIAIGKSLEALEQV